MLGSAALLWPRSFNRDLQATDGTVALATCKYPCRSRTLPDDSARRSVHACHHCIVSMPRDHIDEVLLAPAGQELNRGLETPPHLNRGIRRAESRPEFTRAHLAKSEAVAAASKDGN